MNITYLKCLIEYDNTINQKDSIKCNKENSKIRCRIYVLLNKYPSKDSSSSNNITKYDRHNNIVEVFPKANLLNKYSSCDLLLTIEFNN